VREPFSGCERNKSWILNQVLQLFHFSLRWRQPKQFVRTQEYDTEVRFSWLDDMVEFMVTFENLEDRPKGLGAFFGVHKSRRSITDAVSVIIVVHGIVKRIPKERRQNGYPSPGNGVRHWTNAEHTRHVSHSQKVE
tara:strand:+ start:1017 stop:1424 length:408 start_codon:yes stop_codon:yes gene_type:complete